MNHRGILPVVSLSIFLAFSLPAEDRKSFTTHTYDVNGNRQFTAEVSSSGPYRSQTIQSINGRSVPTEAVEERIISESSSGRVVERVVRKFTPNGQLSGTEKIQIEETKNPDGTTNRKMTVLDSDLNGRFTLRERVTATANKSGEVERTETRVERPDINGGANLEEMRIQVVTGDEKDLHTDLTVLRRNQSGGFSEALRELSQTKVDNGKSITTTTEYNAAITGKMELASQRVVKATRNADGTETRVVDVYSMVAPGRAVDGYQAGAKLREQQVIEQRLGADQSIVETFSVRRANLESGRLGPEHKISETVCSGACLPPAKK